MEAYSRNSIVGNTESFKPKRKIKIVDSRKREAILVGNEEKVKKE